MQAAAAHRYNVDACLDACIRRRVDVAFSNSCVKACRNVVQRARRIASHAKYRFPECFLF